ncbi:Bug family tripartite tricarboxylate transporter substrate binding protein [Falsiroseomonas stagni]|uniref:Tripartite-type tricarboxylate transporter, receptor component TctC n=1 Tax=Falsiroseomonas stagni DSM 19981 TaxID=1123062 RepID=A0A1I4DK50_9PROT|nr:tripartite tricarboxylate transporter substrate binding protein [Falsiroseomonas stagni]SFK93279.1 Tripartite-type tricarboxylate transporter, receptor component TctC [Falsiroseomonas stagni DSM 19981]
MIQRRLLLGTLAAPLLVPALARAQGSPWVPDRPLRLLIGFPPGGASDAAVRIIQPRLSALLGQTVVVDNRAGAGGNLAAEAASRSAPDGTTLVSANIGTLAVNPALVRHMPFHPVNDLAPLSLIFNATNVLVVPASRPWRSVAELVAAAKARPDTITYGTGGVGSPGHLCGILLDKIAGTRTVSVPYRGGGPQMLGLVAGEHDFSFSPMGTVTTHIAAGTIRALGVSTRTRAPELPDVPTMIETGLPDYEVLNWDGILVPRATPAPIRQRLGDVIRQVLAEPEIVSEFAKRGLTPRPTSEAAFAAQLASDSETWQGLIRAAGIEPS